jgi:hypothetical protein
VKTWAATALLTIACAGQPAPNPRVSAAPPPADTLRELVLRAIAAHDRERYFVAYCVAAAAGEVAPAQSREGRVGTAWGLEAPDASRALLAKLGDLPHRFLPASDCMKTAGDYDVVVREGKRQPALLVGIGPMQVVSKRQVELVVFTTSGGLTETATAYTLECRPDGTWYVAREEILLQV